MNDVKNIINDPNLSNISLLFIAEGFTAQQEQLFYNNIFDIYDRISSYECFTKLKQDNSKVAFLSLYAPSANSGTSTSATSAIGNTLLESYIDGNGLHINYEKYEELIENSNIYIESELQPLSSKIIFYDDDFAAITGRFILPIIIFPPTTSPNGELENFQLDQYYFVATTLDNFYEQIIVRSLAKISGLGDEFDLNGQEYEYPDNLTMEAINTSCPNLFSSESVTSMTVDSIYFKWRFFFPSYATSLVIIHPHPSSGTIADRNLPTIPFSYKSIELWEGGAGYRNKVYRPAIDCLQRRRIGDQTLPVKNSRVSLCPICMRCLEKLI
jgi:hypothetical protein